MTVNMIFKHCPYGEDIARQMDYDCNNCSEKSKCLRRKARIRARRIQIERERRRTLVIAVTMALFAVSAITYAAISFISTHFGGKNDVAMATVDEIKGNSCIVDIMPTENHTEDSLEYGKVYINDSVTSSVMIQDETISVPLPKVDTYRAVTTENIYVSFIPESTSTPEATNTTESPNTLTPTDTTEPKTQIATEESELEVAQAPEENDEYVYHFSYEDKVYMAKVVYKESRGEIFEGQVAVASVIINRYTYYNGSQSIYSIVTKPYQFASISDVTMEMLNQCPNCMKAVEEACKGNDPTRSMFSEGARFFYNPKTVGAEAARQRDGVPQISIGNHNFHNDFNR